MHDYSDSENIANRFPTMVLSDYLIPEIGRQWELAKQVGISHAIVRLPEDDAFNMTDPEHIREVTKRYTDYGMHPIVVEPMPNSVHNHIKRGDHLRDECIDKVLHLIPLLAQNGYSTICTNFMAEVGWYRTTSSFPERGGARVTAFDMSEISVDLSFSISEESLWKNLSYFLNSVIPVAEKNNVRIALHPDDPPIKNLGNISRILISKENIQRALDIYPSTHLGITMCQATFAAMGENVYDCIEHFGKQKKILFVHFRDIKGTKENFHETFHDNGMTNMAHAIRSYFDVGYSGPIRVDHVPTMAGESNDKPGYETSGRLYAIGYLRGLCEASGYLVK